MNSSTSCGADDVHTGANESRCSGVGPFSRSTLEMLGRAVALVRGQPVFGIDRVPGADHRVPLDLRDDGGRGNRGRQRIAMDDRRLCALEVDAHGVDQQVVGEQRQLADRFFHRALRRPVDVDLVDGGDVDSGDRPRQRMLANLPEPASRAARGPAAWSRAIRECGTRDQGSPPPRQPVRTETRGRPHLLPQPACAPPSQASFSNFKVHFSRFSRRSFSVAFETCFSGSRDFDFAGVRGTAGDSILAHENRFPTFSL